MRMKAALHAQLAALDAQALRRTRRIAETACAPHMTVTQALGSNASESEDLLCFASNDYLGLANHPRIATALKEGVDLYGAGSGASHLISGHSRAHAALEDKLANWFSPNIPNAQALYFCTGYMANLGVLTGLAQLAGKGETELFCETLNHASLIDGARLAKQNSSAVISVYPHHDLAALAAMLSASNATQKIIVTDSVYSMDGAIAPLTDLLKLAEQYDAWLVVDDAHGFGTLGEQGHGVLQHLGLSSERLIYVGTLGKAAGVGGAFVAAQCDVIEWLVNRSRPYIFTTAAPPALAHALLTSLEIIESDEGKARRAQLNANIAQMQTQLKLTRWQLLPSPTAVQPVVVGSNSDALHAAAILKNAKLWAPAIRPPTVPAGSARLRIALSAAHSTADVTMLIATIQAAEVMAAEAQHNA